MGYTIIGIPAQKSLAARRVRIGWIIFRCLGFISLSVQTTGQSNVGDVGLKAICASTVVFTQIAYCIKEKTVWTIGTLLAAIRN